MQAIGVAGLGAQLLGTGAGTIGNVMSPDVNAKIQDIQSRTIQGNAEFDERQFRRSAKLQAGENVATAAASGLNVTRGSINWDLLDQARQSEIEALSIRRAGKISSDALKLQSRMTRQRIPFDIINGVGLAFGSNGPATSIL